MKKKHLLITTIILTFTLFSTAQTPLPYYSGFDNAQQQAGWKEYELGATDDTYHWALTGFNAFTPPSCLAHYYPVGGSQQTDDWYISPEFDFEQGGLIDSLRYSFTGFGTPNTGDTIALYLLTGSDNPDQASAKIVLYNFTDSNYTNDDVWRKLDSLEIPPTSGKSYLAFRYTTVNNWLDVKIDNLSISGMGTNALDQLQANPGVSVFPNPTNNYLNINWEKGPVKPGITILDGRGRIMIENAVSKQFINSVQISVSDLTPGIYFLQLTDAAGNRFTEKFIKE